jgi:hypothetical protein
MNHRLLLELFAVGADISIGFAILGEVRAAEGAVGSLRLSNAQG